MSIRMSNVTLTNIPGHIGRRKRSRNTELLSELIRGVNLGGCLEPPRHPYAACLIVPGLARHRTTASPLTILAKKDLRLTATDGTESWRIAPRPKLLPTETLKPRKAVGHARDVQYRSDTYEIHRQSFLS